jgi:hypothetical protein
MWRPIISIIGIIALAGCGGPTPYPRTAADATLFGPLYMRIHPIFTQVKDWTGDDIPDGIEALVELQDQFGDSTKASGQVIFELFEYRRNDPEPRGQRLLNPWIGDLNSLEAQQQRWNRTSRTYSFQLSYPQIQTSNSYVLTATFELSGGGRFFNRIILAPREPIYDPYPTLAPASAPTSRPE